MAAKVASSDSKWRTYFASIKKVCPWSSKLMDKILVWDSSENCLNTIAYTFRNTSFEAFVFVLKDKSPSELDSLCDAMNLTHKDSEFLWSHPMEGGDSTHVPCVIQQDRATLTKLRENIGYVYET